MTYAITLLKGSSGKRIETRSFLTNLSKNKEFQNECGVEIEKVLVSFGWPDFVVIMKGNNVELIKHAIVKLRDTLEKNGVNANTSTIICTTLDSLEEKKREWTSSIPV